MNTPLAIVLAVFIVGGLTLDALYADGQNTLFLARKFTDFTDWIAFWR